MLSESDRRYLDLLKRCLTASLYDESAWGFVEAEAEVLRALQQSKELSPAFVDAVLAAAPEQDWALVKKRPYDAERRRVGRDWPLFGYTMVGHERLDNVLHCVRDVVERDVPGDLVEAGIWRGGTVIWMRAILEVLNVRDRLVWAADSFEGMPKPRFDDDGHDLSAVEYLRVGLDEVKRNFQRFDLLDDQVRFLQGWFRDTLPDAPIEEIAVLRLDADMYTATTETLESLYDRVSPGGYVIVDDYHSWPACRRAVDDFLARQEQKPAMEAIDWAGAFWIVP